MLWLIENATTVYLLLATLAILLLVAYWKTRERRLLYGVAGTVGVAVLVGLLRLFFGGLSDQLQIENSLEAMRQAVRNRDADELFKHMAADFRFGGMDRRTFRGLVERALQSGGVTDVQYRDLEHAQVTRGPAPGKGSATIEFSVKPEGGLNSQRLHAFCKATFVLEADGKWRLQTFEVRDPVTNQPLDVSQLRP
jgi:ketosteroid isomerase-like protein